MTTPGNGADPAAGEPTMLTIPAGQSYVLLTFDGPGFVSMPQITTSTDVHEGAMMGLGDILNEWGRSRLRAGIARAKMQDRADQRIVVPGRG